MKQPVPIGFVSGWLTVKALAEPRDRSPWVLCQCKCGKMHEARAYHISRRLIKSMSIERIDNSADYAPENCRWATPIEQASNQRSNWHVSLRGGVMTAAEATRRLGWRYARLYKILYKSAASKNNVFQLDEHIAALA